MLRFKRVLSALLVVLILSGQLVGAIPGLCGCADHQVVEDRPSCCTHEPVIPQASTSQSSSPSPQSCCTTETSCSCGKTCGQGSVTPSCVCGCGSDPAGEEIPKQDGTTQGTRLIEQVASAPSPSMAKVIRSIQQDPGIGEVSSVSAESVSACVLFCVWRT